MSELYASVREACGPAVADQVAGGDAPKLVDEALAAELPAVLRHLMGRTYVTEFHRFREAAGLPADPASTTASEAFHAQLSGDVVGVWFTEYPVLKRLLTTVVSRRAAELQRVASAVQAELEGGSLVEAGILPAGHGDVAGLRSLASDLHNGGRSVCAVTLTSGDTVIYKPRPLAIERVATGVFDVVADASGIDVSGCVPASLDRGDHGWQAFVAARPLGDGADAEEYFARLGVVAAVLTVVGGVDMHHENIVACGDTPVLVDLETFLHAEPAIAETHLANALLAARRRSIASTLLLPQRVPQGPYSVLLGGIGVPVEQVSDREDFVLVNGGTDAVDIARQRFPYAHTDNIPVDGDGVRYSALDRADAFMAGFEGGHRACVRRRAELTSILRQPVPVRHILRGTAIYYRFLSAASHPDHLRSEDEFRRILGLLGAPPGWDSKANAAFATGEELAALADGDIPYFSVPSDDIRVQGRDGRSAGFFDASPRDRAVEGLATAQAEGSLPSRSMIEIGLDELGGVMGRRSGLSTHTFDGVLTDAGASWRAAADRLRSLAVRAHAASGEQAGWLTAGYGGDMATFDPGPAISLYDTGGIEILMSRIATSRPEGEDVAFAAAVRRGNDALELVYREALEHSLSSVVSGPASLVYMRSSDAVRSPAIEAYAARAATDVQDDPGDLLTGVPGYGALLAGFPETPAELLERLLERTRAALAAGTLTRDPWNLAHGELGLVWGLHRLANRLDDAEGVAEAAERLEVILGAATDPPAGWCNGAGGLAMVGAELLPGADPRLAELAQRMTDIAEDEPVDVSVCHGLGGTVQTLVHLARKGGEAWPLELGEDHLAHACAVAARSGALTGVHDRTNLPGYFLGWAGLADSVLALELEREGQAPWLPVAFGPAAAGVPA